MTSPPDPPPPPQSAPDSPSRGGPRADLLAPAFLVGLGAVLLAAMAAKGPLALYTFAAMGDTQDYLTVAEGLWAGDFVATERTLGYPLFLAATGLIDPLLGPLLAQVALLGWTTWALQRTARRLAPDAPAWAHRGSALLIGGSGLGMSLTLMTDFVCAVAVYRCVEGALTDRRGQAVGWGMAAALIRPTWAAAPALFLALALWRRRPGWWAAAAGLCLGLLLSVAHQREVAEHWGRSGILSANLRDFTTRALPEGTPGRFDAHAAEHGPQVAFLRVAAAEPRAFAAAATGASLRYTFAPVERVGHIVWQIAQGDPPATTVADAMTQAAAHPLPRWMRAVLMLGTAPILALLFWPAAGPRVDRWLIPLLLLLFVVVVSSLAPHQGERMRLPALLLFSGNAAANLARGWPRRPRSPALSAFIVLLLGGALLLPNPAQAGPEKRVERLLEAGQVEDALARCDTLIQKVGDAHSLDAAVFEVCALARWQDAAPSEALDRAWLDGFAQQWTDTPAAALARTQAAAIALREAGDNALALRAAAAAYPEAPTASMARTRARDATFRDAGDHRSTDAMRAFLDEFPDAPQAEEAHSLLLDFAFEDAEELGTSAGWQALIAAHPEHPRRRIAERRHGGGGHAGLLQRLTGRGPRRRGPGPPLQRLPPGPLRAVPPRPRPRVAARGQGPLVGPRGPGADPRAGGWRAQPRGSDRRRRQRPGPRAPAPRWPRAGDHPPPGGALDRPAVGRSGGEDPAPPRGARALRRPLGPRAHRAGRVRAGLGCARPPTPRAAPRPRRPGLAGPARGRGLRARRRDRSLAAALPDLSAPLRPPGASARATAPSSGE